MASFSVKRLSQILSDMIIYIIANQDALTDFNEGSLIRTFCESIGIEMEELYVKVKLGFTESLFDIPLLLFLFPPLTGQKAAGLVIFSRTGTTGIVAILTGTIVVSDDGVRFETTADGSIADGNTSSSPIPIMAVSEGRGGNVPANTINTIETPITGIDSVTNAAGTTGGQNAETESQYQRRFAEMIEGLGGANLAGIKKACRDVTGVRSVSIIEHFPPIDTYNMSVYIDDGAGNCPDVLKAAVELKLLGDGTENNEGTKAGGIKLRVLAPSKRIQNIAMAVVTDGISDVLVIEAAIEAALLEHFSTLELGKDIIYNKLIDIIMGITGVTDVNLTTPSANVSIASDEIAVIGTITFS